MALSLLTQSGGHAGPSLWLRVAAVAKANDRAAAEVECPSSRCGIANKVVGDHSQAWQRCADLSEASAMTGIDLDALSQYLNGAVFERQYSTCGEGLPLLRLNPGVDAMANSLGTRFIARWEDNVEGAAPVRPDGAALASAPPAMVNASATPQRHRSTARRQ